LSTTKQSRSEWNTSWTCIDFDNFSLYEELTRFRLMKELSILSFSFLKDLVSEFRSMKVRVLQRIKNKHKNYSSNTIIEFSNKNLSLWESRHWVYKRFYCRFSETLSLREFLPLILKDSEFTRIQVTYKSWCFIDDKNSSHIQSSRNLAEIACNFANFINDAWT